MQLFLKSAGAFFVLSMIFNVVFGQAPQPGSATQPATKPAGRSMGNEERKVNMSRVKILLDKAREEELRGNDAGAGKFLAELNDMAYQAWDFQDVTTSETIFRQILTVKADFPDALFGLAELYRRTNPVWATEYYTKYLQINPSEVKAYYGRGSCYLAREAYTLAIQDLKYLVDQLAPNHVEGLTNLALAYRGRAMERSKDPELFKQAVDYMKRAVQSAEMMNNPESLKMLPELRYRLGRLILEYDQILAAAQREVDFREAIGYLMQAVQSAYEAAGREPENLQNLDQILYALDALSEVYSTQSRLNPKNPDPYVELARIVMKKLEIQTRQAQVLALNFYKRAVEADPSVAENWSSLSRTYYQLGATKSALQAINKAIALAPNNADFKKIRDQLENKAKTPKPVKSQ